jgi:uncharacterized membrane protein (UPF0127 family)
MMGTLACSEDPCDDLREIQLHTAGMEDSLAFCAHEAITVEERKAGLLAYPPLQENEALLIVFPIEGEVCITTEDMAYAIDVLFLNEEGAVVESGCDRDTTEPILCVDGVKEVLETLPQSNCEELIGWSTLK